jgi:crossover junction endodeoxyribonuclease RuvC
MILLGIDPGCSGALALVEDGRLRDVVDFPTLKLRKTTPDLQSLALWLDGLKVSRAIIEEVGAMPKQGVTSSFNFGFACGAVQAAVAANYIPIEMVRPQVWKKHFHLTADKDSSRQRAMREWPDKAGLFARVKDDGRAEAALIALWGFQHREGDR